MLNKLIHEHFLLTIRDIASQIALGKLHGSPDSSLPGLGNHHLSFVGDGRIELLFQIFDVFFRLALHLFLHLLSHHFGFVDDFFSFGFGVLYPGFLGGEKLFGFGSGFFGSVYRFVDALGTLLDHSRNDFIPAPDYQSGEHQPVHQVALKVGHSIHDVARVMHFSKEKH